MRRSLWMATTAMAILGVAGPALAQRDAERLEDAVRREATRRAANLEDIQRAQGVFLDRLQSERGMIAADQVRLQADQARILGRTDLARDLNRRATDIERQSNRRGNDLRRVNTDIGDDIRDVLVGRARAIDDRNVISNRTLGLGGFGNIGLNGGLLGRGFSLNSRLGGGLGSLGGISNRDLLLLGGGDLGIGRSSRFGGSRFGSSRFGRIGGLGISNRDLLLLGGGDFGIGRSSRFGRIGGLGISNRDLLLLGGGNLSLGLNSRFGGSRFGSLGGGLGVSNRDLLLLGGGNLGLGLGLNSRLGVNRLLGGGLGGVSSRDLLLLGGGVGNLGLAGRGFGRGVFGLGGGFGSVRGARFAINREARLVEREFDLEGRRTARQLRRLGDLADARIFGVRGDRLESAFDRAAAREFRAFERAGDRAELQVRREGNFLLRGF